MDLGPVSSLLSNWPTDWIIIGACAALVALDALRSGTSRATAVVLAIPATLVLSDALSHAAILGQMTAQFSTSAAQALLFGVILVLAYFAIHRMIYSFSENGGVLQALIAGIAATAVIAVFWLQEPALMSLWHFGAQVQQVFGESYRFWWLAGAYLVFAYIRS